MKEEQYLSGGRGSRRGSREIRIRVCLDVGSCVVWWDVTRLGDGIGCSRVIKWRSLWAQTAPEVFWKSGGELCCGEPGQAHELGQDVVGIIVQSASFFWG